MRTEYRHTYSRQVAWTDERIDRITELWKAGLSASQIAAQIGDVTRNAVIGKLHRLGMMGRKAPPRRSTSAQSQASRASRRKANVQRLRQAKTNRQRFVYLRRLGLVENRTQAQIEASMNDVPPENRVKHNDLESHHCRWPCGDPKEPDFGFCGAAPVPGKPYCAHHTHVAHNPPELRPVAREQEKETA